jgi:hypothetical protein
MIRIIITVWTIIALVTAVVTTIMQIEPAIYVILMITDSHNTFSVALSVGITFLILISPVLVFAVIMIFYYRLKYKMPDTTGKTGISVFRKSKLMDAFYPFDVFVDNEFKGKIVNGHTIFVEIFSGSHTIKIKSGKRHSNELQMEVKKGEIIKTMVSINPAVNKTIFPHLTGSFNTYLLTSVS